MRDQVQSAWLYNLIQAYFSAARDTTTTAASNEKRLKRFDKAMLLSDQFCLGDQVSNTSAPASAYRQYHMSRIILTRIYHKLFLTRQFGKASDLAEYLKMLA